MYDDPFRQTGRTTRMLLEAWEQACYGKHVVVIYGAAREHDHMKLLLQAHDPGFVDRVEWMRGTMIRVKGGGSVRFLSMNDGLVNIRCARVQGYPSTTPVYIDHHVYDLF